MADPRVIWVDGFVWSGTIGYAAAKAGDLVYYDLVSDNNKWEKADATLAFAQTGAPYGAYKYAQAIVVHTGPKDGDPCVLAKEAWLCDVDAAPFNQGGKMLYLSETAGAITETRPTTAGDLVQVIGETVDAPNYGSSLTADKTQLVHIVIRGPYELTYNISPNGGTSGENRQLDSGNFIACNMDAQNEDLGYSFAIPQNAIDIEAVYIWLAAEDTGGTPTFDLFVSIATDGDQWDANTQDTGIADSAAEGAAVDEIQRTDVTAGFDTAAQIKTGELVMARVTKDDTGTDITVFGPLQVVFTCV